MENQQDSLSPIRDLREIALKVVDNINAMVAYWDRNQICVFANNAYIKWFGKSRDQMIGHSLKELLGPIYSQNLPFILEALNGKVQVFERELPTPNGLRHTMATYIPDIVGGIAQGFFVHVADVTEMKRLELDLKRAKEKIEENYHALQMSDSRLNLVVEQVPSILWTTDKNLIFTTSLGAGLEALNLKKNQVVGTSISAFLKTDDPENASLSAHYRALNGYATTYNDEFGDRSYLSHIEPFYDHNGNIIGTIGIATDVSEIRKVTKALAAEKEQLVVTLQSIGDAVITTNKEGRVSIMNPVAERLTGWNQTEAGGKMLSEVFRIFNEQTGLPADDPVSRVISTGQIIALSSQTLLKSRNGVQWAIADSGAPIRDREGNIQGVVLVFRDITQEQNLQKEILKQMKLESIGLLAGGIAHDFNNILTAILGNLSLARMELDPKSPTSRFLDETETATLKARDLASQLLAFSKGGVPQKKVTSISGLFKESAEFVLRGSSVRSEFSFPKDLWKAEVDTGQITQVVHNLVINAQQAMPEGGEIAIQAGNVIIDEQQSRTLLLKPGPYIWISVKDRGKGIPESLINRIFDPFFTTKERGSGLGLFSAYSIIKNHAGTIKLESELDVGTTFTVYLPAASAEIRAMDPDLSTEDAILKGNGRILLMDDEEMVRKMASSMLKKLGYEVESVATGQEALEIYKRRKEESRPFQAVVLDLTIPGGKGGNQTIQELLEYDPDVRVVVSSGYSNDPVMANFQEYGFKGCVAKPYRIQDLSKTLHDLLQKRDPESS